MPNSSWGWKGLIWGKQILLKGAKRKIKDGNQIDLFTEEWIPKHRNPFAITSTSASQVNLKVCHLFNPIFKQWREPLIRCLFPTQVIPDILSIHIPRVPHQDERIWRFTRSGNYSVKTGYFQIVMHQQGHDHSVFSMWFKLWALKLPPKYVLFIQKVLHRILAVKDVLVRRKIGMDLLCPRCKIHPETIELLFLQCP